MGLAVPGSPRNIFLVMRTPYHKVDKAAGHPDWTDTTCLSGQPEIEEGKLKTGRSKDSVDKPRILVIDDNPSIHADFRKVLCEERFATTAIDAAERALFGDSTSTEKQHHFEVNSAFQGQEGVAKVHHALQEGHPYDIAFVDVRMPPGLDGIETIPRLWIADPNLQIVICTAYSDYSWEDIFAKLGHSDQLFIIKKPFDRAEVLQMAHALTERRRILLGKGRSSKRHKKH